MADGAWLTHTNRKILSLEMAALHRRTLPLTCQVCPHFRLFEAMPVWWLFSTRHWSTALKDAPQRFWCSECRRLRFQKVRGPLIEITDEPPAGPQFDYPPKAEWNRLVRRHRS